MTDTLPTVDLARKASLSPVTYLRREKVKGEVQTLLTR